MRKASGTIAAVLALVVPTGVRADLVNGNFDAGNTGFSVSPNYSLQTSGETSPGHYGVIANPATAYTNGYASFPDHTSGHGLMLLVDATTVANSPFWSETVTVTPNTQYTFTGWATSGSQLSPPMIELLVGSTAVGSVFNVSGDTPGLWQQFTDTFNSGSATSITLNLVDVNLTANGNDFAVDDLSLTAASSVPEPGSFAIAAFGVAAALAYRRFRAAF